MHRLDPRDGSNDIGPRITITGPRLVLAQGQKGIDISRVKRNMVRVDQLAKTADVFALASESLWDRTMTASR